MKTRLLKKLRTQAKKKYTIEPFARGNYISHWRIMLNDKEGSKTLFFYEHIGDAIKVRDKLRRKDILHNVGIIRYHHLVKKYK